MQDFEEHEQRLAAALRRLSAATARVVEPPSKGAPARAVLGDAEAEAEIARLKDELETARFENEYMIEEAREFTEKQAAQLSQAQLKLQELSVQFDHQTQEVQRLRLVSEQLREALRGLRGALVDKRVDAGQINKAMEVELEAIRAARQSEAFEIETLLRAIDPLLSSPAEGDASDAAAAEDQASPAAETDMTTTGAAGQNVTGGLDA